MAPWMNRGLPACMALVVMVCLCSFAESTGSDVSATGGLSARVISKDGTLSFWVNLKNKGNADLASLRLVKFPDDYELIKVCVLDNKGTPACIDRTALNAKQGEVAPQLAKGQSLTVWGELKPQAEKTHKAEVLNTVVAWNVPPGGPGHSMTVPLGENQVQGTFEGAPWISDLIIKGLAIPFVLAVGGIVWNEVNKRRESRQHKKEEDRAFRSETWKQMLPVSHNYAAKFYLPVSTAAERAIRALGRADNRLAFFYFLLALKRVAETTNEIGGFYFKDLMGEQLAGACLTKFRQAFLGPESQPCALALRGSAEILKASETFESFERKFASTAGGNFKIAILVAAWTHFNQALTDADRMRRTRLYLTGFYTILDYEANRPYEFWYQNEIKMDADKETEETLKEIAREKHFSEDEIKHYFAAIRR